MTPPAPPKRPPGRPRANPSTTTVTSVEPSDDHAATLREGLGLVISTVVAEVRILTAPPVSPESNDRARELGTWLSETRGQVVRADSHVVKRKPTPESVIKDFGALNADGQAHVLERIGADGKAGSVLS